MTNISLGRQGNRYHIEANGHATGSNEVCACISYTIYSLLAYLENNPIKVLEKEMDDGFSRIEWEDDTDTVYEYICLSLMQLSANYPKLVRIKSKISTFFDKEK